MELLYIWLGESKDKNVSLPFENQEICFSNEYLIAHEKSNNNLHTFSVGVKEIREAEKSFYKIKEYKKLENCNIKLTCFVGKNGAGKTLLLETLINILYRHETKRFLSKYDSYLIVWKEDDRCLYEGKSVKPLPSNLFSKKEFNSSDTNIVFYSPYINDLKNNKQYINRPNVFDISTNSLLENEESRALEKTYKNYRLYDKDTVQDKLNIFNLAENVRKILFYSERINKKFLKDKFNDNNLSRNYYVISPSDFYWRLFCNKKEDEQKTYYTYLKKLNKIGNKTISNYIDKTQKYILRRIDKEINAFDRLLWLYVRELWIIILSYATLGFDLGKISNYKHITTNFDARKKITPCDFLCGYIKELSSIFSNSLSADIKEKIINYIKNFFSFINKFESRCLKYGTQCLNIPLKGKQIGLKELFELLKKYSLLKESLDNSDFSNFYFAPRYSCGEDSLIALYARLFSLFKVTDRKKNIKSGSDKNIYDCKTLFVFVDEGEMGFHPEWSKKYVYALFNYIQYLINTYKPNASELNNIHIIISTNSPIVLSDMLPQNVFYMEDKNIAKECKFAFGSNILDIYSESFFINTGLIGRFAQEKINKVIEFINSKETKTTQDLTKVKFIINNVGDLNIKSFLQSLFNIKCKRSDLE